MTEKNLEGSVLQITYRLFLLAQVFFEGHAAASVLEVLLLY
jgi:hypothetical protein